MKVFYLKILFLINSKRGWSEKKLIGVILINYLFKKNIIDILKYYKKIKNKKLCAVNRNCRNNFLIIAVKKKVFFSSIFQITYISSRILCVRGRRE